MTEEPLIENAVNVPETRPALWAGGVPLEVASALICVTTELAVMKWWYASVMLAVWPAVILAIRHDYNLMRVWWTEIRTSAIALDSHVWGGASVSAFPVRPYQHYRGVPPDAW